MSQYRIAVLVGSLRRESYNRLLANALVTLAPSELGLTQVRFDDLPLYNQDHDGNPAESVKRFKSEIGGADGVIFVTAEYNRSVPGVLKNAIDQGSRPYGQSAWAGKPAGVMGASIGAMGTSMAQQHLRNILAYLDAPTLGQPEMFVSVTNGLFDEGGALVNAERRKALQTWMERYAAWVKQHAAT